MKKNKGNRIKRFLNNVKYAFKNPLTYGWIVLFIVLAIATVVVFKTETQTESGIETMFDSVWFTLVSVMAGYFDYCVKSVGGRMAALVLLALGMVLLSVVTGKIASVFMDMQMKKNKGLNKITDAATEGIAALRKETVVLVQQVREHLEDGHLPGREAVDDTLLPRPHLVDDLLLGNVRPFSRGEPLRHRPVSLLLHIRVRLVESVPRKAALHEAMGKEFFPDLLTGELIDDAFHGKKRKRGRILNPQNCGSRDGTRPGRLQGPVWTVLHPPQAQRLLHPLFL